MKQIANRAGVSISTVSLVLNNRDIGRVSPDVAERVLAIAAELGYLTNRLASGLRTSSSRTIGFLSDEVATTPFAGRMIEGAQDAARTLGYLLLTVGINSGAKSSDREILTLRQFGVDGFIYARMFNQKTMLPQSLQGCKVVLADSTDAAEVAPSIVPDEHSIGFKAQAISSTPAAPASPTWAPCTIWSLSPGECPATSTPSPSTASRSTQNS